MKRYGMVINVKPGMAGEYKRLHADVWPDVLKAITESNIKNYSIYFKDNQLFSYFEYVGNDYDADMKKMAANPVVQDWWNKCIPLLQPLPNLAEGEVWANMEEVFHMD
ncbi:MAG: L-rhamnose mutarotase [Chlorobi bacterium]|nr:L-rhamnose mutarotase [Chlorobiota bacterium]